MTRESPLFGRGGSHLCQAARQGQAFVSPGGLASSDEVSRKLVSSVARRRRSWWSSRYCWSPSPSTSCSAHGSPRPRSLVTIRQARVVGAIVCLVGAVLCFCSRRTSGVGASVAADDLRYRSARPAIWKPSQATPFGLARDVLGIRTTWTAKLCGSSGSDVARNNTLRCRDGDLRAEAQVHLARWRIAGPSLRRSRARISSSARVRGCAISLKDTFLRDAISSFRRDRLDPTNDEALLASSSRSRAAGRRAAAAWRLGLERRRKRGDQAAGAGFNVLPQPVRGAGRYSGVRYRYVGHRRAARRRVGTASAASHPAVRSAPAVARRRRRSAGLAATQPQLFARPRDTRAQTRRHSSSSTRPAR